MTTLFINIKELIQVRELSEDKVYGKDMGVLPIIKNAFMLIKAIPSSTLVLWIILILEKRIKWLISPEN